MFSAVHFILKISIDQTDLLSHVRKFFLINKESFRWDETRQINRRRYYTARDVHVNKTIDIFPYRVLSRYFGTSLSVGGKCGSLLC